MMLRRSLLALTALACLATTAPTTSAFAAPGFFSKAKLGHVHYESTGTYTGYVFDDPDTEFGLTPNPTYGHHVEFATAKGEDAMNSARTNYGDNLECIMVVHNGHQMGFNDASLGIVDKIVKCGAPGSL